MFRKIISGKKNNNFKNENENLLKNLEKVFSILLVSGILATMPNMAFARGHGHHFRINHNNNTVHYEHNNKNIHIKNNLNKENGFFSHLLNNIRKWGIFGHGHGSNQDANQTVKNQKSLQQRFN